MSLQPGSSRWRPLWRSLAGLGILTVAALVGTALLLGIILFRLASEFDPLLIIIPAIPLIVAGVVAIGWRWAPIRPPSSAR